ncbi:MAG: tRNA-intron lyase [Halobacteriales archaeon]|nr:tRNA-intron lyase [Halobacteriales archaeon]
MQTRVEGDTVQIGHAGREQFYDSRGYGHPVDGDLHLSRVEAAHLLYRGDIDSIEGMSFREFFEAEAGLASRFLVYKDLRDRGFYLTPARQTWVENADGIDFVVYPRGKGPWDDIVEYRVRVVAEHDDVDADELGDVVLAVVDEESELTYLETSYPEISGTATDHTEHGADAALLDDRVVVWEPPEWLYAEGFYGQRLDDDRTAIQLSLIEGAYLAEQGVLSFPGGREAVLDLGHETEGDRFDRRLTVYTALRARGIVPKTGFKFGADFRTYADVSSVDDLGHSERLVRVLPADHTFAPRDLSLDVRLAHGVRKQMVFAFTDGTSYRSDVDPNGEVEWLSVQRLTP